MRKFSFTLPKKYKDIESRYSDYNTVLYDYIDTYENIDFKNTLLTYNNLINEDEYLTFVKNNAPKYYLLPPNSLKKHTVENSIPFFKISDICKLDSVSASNEAREVIKYTKNICVNASTLIEAGGNEISAIFHIFPNNTIESLLVENTNNIEQFNPITMQHFADVNIFYSTSLPYYVTKLDKVQVKHGVVVDTSLYINKEDYLNGDVDRELLEYNTRRTLGIAVDY